MRDYETFTRIFGTHSYQPWPGAILRGPSAWFTRLPQARQEEHLNWVNLVQLIQSKCPDGYVGLRNLNELPEAWFSDEFVPDTQLYVNNCPELQDLELNNLLTTWCGVLWPGNPVTIASSLMKQDADNGKTGISNGLVSLRFITVEAAKLFKKLFHGVEIYYQNYEVEGFMDASGQD